MNLQSVATTRALYPVGLGAPRDGNAPGVAVDVHRSDVQVPRHVESALATCVRHIQYWLIKSNNAEPI